MIMVWLWWILYHQKRDNGNYFQGLSYDCESSLYFPYVLPLWLVLLSYPDNSTSFAHAEVSESLLHWFSIEVSKLVGKTTVVF